MTTATITAATTVCARCKHWFRYPEREAGLCGVRDHADGSPHESKAGSSCPRWKPRPEKKEGQR